MQPRDALELVARKPNGGAVELQRQHQVMPHIHEPEPFRQDADNLARLPIGHDASANDLRIAAEPALPVAITKHHDLGTAARVVFLREPAAENRLDAQHRQQPKGGRDPIDAFRVRELRHRGRPSGPNGDIGEGLRFLPVRNVVGDRRVEIFNVHARRGLPGSHQAVRLREGKRLQQHAVDHAEDRSVRPDAQRQGHHRSDGKDRRPGQAAHRVP